MFGRGRSSHHALAEMADRLGLDNRKLGARARVAPERVAYALENDIDLEAVLSVGEVKRILEVLIWTSWSYSTFLCLLQASGPALCGTPVSSQRHADRLGGERSSAVPGGAAGQAGHHGMVPEKLRAHMGSEPDASLAHD